MSHAISGAFTQHQRLIWGLCYRMLGTVADADEILQETFVRALENSPSEDRDLRPWLVRVAANLSRDRLRRRRRRPYAGQWLPSPIDTGPQEPFPWLRQVPVDLQLEQVQSASFAWLVAVEALTPNQRAVLVLREVMELSTAETASALGMTGSNVKVTLHRAKNALIGRDGHSLVATRETREEGALLIGRLGAALQAGDLDAVVALFTEDAWAVSDGGGVYHAAMNPVIGAVKVAKLYLGLMHKGPTSNVALRLINGQPAVVTWWDRRRDNFAPHAVISIRTREGRIDRIWSVLAPGKLSGL